MSRKKSGERPRLPTGDRRRRGPRLNWMAGSLLLAGIAAAAGHATAGDQTTAIHLRYDRQELNSTVGARRLLHRIGDAALEACGASPFSLTEFKMATEHSRCWRDAVDEAVRRIGSPTLSAVTREQLP